MRFKDKVVVVTGAGAGIGLCTALAFAREGATLAITDVTESAVTQAVSQIRAVGGLVLGQVGDVSDRATVQAQADAIMASYGQVDILVNNAGLIRRSPTEDVPMEDWRFVMAVNVDGTFYWSQAVAKRSMIPRRTGAIVNLSSIAGKVAQPNAASYVTSKHAVIGLTKALAVDWARYGIRVNALCPGLTMTNISAADVAKNPNHYKDRTSRIPLGQAGEPEDQASAILYLASPEARYITGSAMDVDGGQIALSSGNLAPRL